MCGLLFNISHQYLCPLNDKFNQTDKKWSLFLALLVRIVQSNSLFLFFFNKNYLELDQTQLVTEQVLREDREPNQWQQEGLPVGPQPRQVQEARRGMQAMPPARSSQHSPEHVTTR